MDSWSTAYKKALRISAIQVDNNLVHSIYFGGGTPSLMSSRLVYEVINEISKEFKVSSDAEISLEANPTSVEYGKFKSYSASGVNRCSLGIQALNDPDLKSLGRLHSVNDALRAFDSARQCFKTSSFDLIYGRQNQTIGEWENELKRAMSLHPQHLSLYQLTIEPGTPFFKLQQKNRLRGLPNDSKSCAFYTKTKEICKNNELVHYEISNFATKGHEEETTSGLNWIAGEVNKLDLGTLNQSESTCVPKSYSGESVTSLFRKLSQSSCLSVDKNKAKRSCSTGESDNCEKTNL